MNWINSERSYSLLTLQPHSEESRKDFIKFRRKDVVFMFLIQLPLMLLCGVINLLLYIWHDDFDHLSRLVFAAAFALPTIVSWLLRNKVLFFHFLPFCWVLWYASNAYMTISLADSDENGPAAALAVGMQRSDNLFVLSSMLMTPSMTSFLVGTLPPYIISQLFMMATLADFGNPAVRTRFASAEPIKLISVFAIFYILQLRELKRFNE